jgi:hypothetical protein
MPHDPIERWEWEGGAIAAGVRAEAEPDDVPGRPAEPGAPAEAAQRQSSLTISSGDGPRVASAPRKS